MAAEQFREIFCTVLEGGPDGDGNFTYPPGPLRGIWPMGTVMRPHVMHPTPGTLRIEQAPVDLQEEAIWHVLDKGKLPPREHTVRNIARDVLAGADAGALSYLFLLYANSGQPQALAQPLLIAAEGAVAAAALGGLVWAGLKRVRAQRDLIHDILAKKPQIEASQQANRESVEQRRRGAHLRGLNGTFSNLLKNGHGIDGDSLALVDELARLYCLAQENDPKSRYVVQHLTATMFPNDKYNKMLLAAQLKGAVPSDRNRTIREARALAEYQWEETCHR